MYTCARSWVDNGGTVPTDRSSPDADPLLWIFFPSLHTKHGHPGGRWTTRHRSGTTSMRSSVHKLEVSLEKCQVLEDDNKNRLRSGGRGSREKPYLFLLNKVYVNCIAETKKRARMVPRPSAGAP